MTTCVPLMHCCHTRDMNEEPGLMQCIAPLVRKVTELELTIDQLRKVG